MSIYDFKMNDIEGKIVDFNSFKGMINSLNAKDIGFVGKNKKEI